MTKTKTLNAERLKVIRLLKVRANDTGASIWDDLAKRLGKSKHRRVCVNLSKVNRHSKEGETLVVPGKVLGTGKVDHPVHVAAFSFSRRAKEGIVGAGGECLTIRTLLERKKGGSGVKIIG